eukprot:TRINITY_DN17391_c0_g1_i1.p1 TRINITY_DN17391_c0_g1~~TRINITY_DN17391_c0_g1_i1.p1  ORF type:complete len:107 (+),score=19.99 TRINITY_DN17391_c0_g1_i1:42-323(+)
MCPPQPEASSQAPPTASAAAATSQSGIVLSCGHVEANLAPSSIQDVLQMLELVAAKALEPLQSDGQYDEYSNGNFTLMLAKKDANNLMQIMFS